MSKHSEERSVLNGRAWLGSLAFSAMLALSACGGGDDDRQSSQGDEATRMHAADRSETGGSINAAFRHGHTREWSDVTTVVSFDRDQNVDFAIADSGDVYFAWQAPHLESNGDHTGVDIWVRQYEAATRHWLAPRAVATVPSSEGVARHASVVSVSGGSTFVMWDVTEVEVTFLYLAPPALPQPVAWLKRPAQLYVSQQAPGREAWSAPQPVPATLSHPLGRVPAQHVYVFDAGWKAVDAGQGRLGVFWLGEHQYLSSFYSGHKGTWSEARDMGASTGLQIPGEPYQPEGFFEGGTPQPLFNRRGSGIVTFVEADPFYSQRPPTALGRPAFQLHRGRGWTPISASFFPASALVDDEGDVHYIELRPGDYGEGDLIRHTLPAAQPGTVQSRSIYHWANFSALPDDIELVQGRHGPFVSWSQAFFKSDPYACPTCWDARSVQWARLVQPLTPDAGEPAGPLEVRYDISLEPNLLQSSLYHLMTRAAGSSVLSVWGAGCGRVDPCGKMQMYASTKERDGEWSVPTPVRTASPIGGSLKVNQRGEAVLVQSRYGDDNRMHVTATLLH